MGVESMTYFNIKPNLQKSRNLKIMKVWIKYFARSLTWNHHKLPRWLIISRTHLRRILWKCYLRLSRASWWCKIAVSSILNLRRTVITITKFYPLMCVNSTKILLCDSRSNLKKRSKNKTDLPVNWSELKKIKINYRLNAIGRKIMIQRIDW